MSIGRVRGKVELAGVDPEGNAVARIRLSNTTPEKVAEMFLKDDPKEFFPTAHSYLRTPTATGGQRMLENPKMPGPIMLTQIEPGGKDANGALLVKSTFQGLITGGSTLTISKAHNGDVILEEKTRVRPNFMPGMGAVVDLAAKVPFFGTFVSLGKSMMDGMAAVTGTFLAALHAQEVPSGALQAMEATLTRKNNRP